MFACLYVLLSAMIDCFCFAYLLVCVCLFDSMRFVVCCVCFVVCVLCFQHSARICSKRDAINYSLLMGLVHNKRLSTMVRMVSCLAVMFSIGSPYSPTSGQRGLKRVDFGTPTVFGAKSVLTPAMPTLCTGQDARLWFIGRSCLLKFGIDTIGIAFRTNVCTGCQHTTLLI